MWQNIIGAGGIITKTMTTKKIPLKSLQKILDYLFEDEQRHYSELMDTEGKNSPDLGTHILHDLIELKKFLKEYKEEESTLFLQTLENKKLLYKGLWNKQNRGLGAEKGVARIVEFPPAQNIQRVARGDF